MSSRGEPRAFDRRTFLRRSAGTAAAAGACLIAPYRYSARAQEVVVGTTRIGERLTLTAGLGGNVVALATSDGTVVVDSGAAAYANGLDAMIRAATGGAQVTTLLNTHWHLDQVGGNALFGERGARIIAHAKTLAHLSTPYYLPDEDRYQEPLPEAGHPTEKFFDRGSLELGGERIDYGYLLEAHTDGDIYVHFVDRNLIAAGDAISPLRDPEFDWFGGGWVGGRIDSLERLLELSDGATRFVPAYGRIVDRSYVEREHELMLGLYDILWERVRAGETAEDILASGALDALPRRFDDPGKLLYAAHKSMWAHYNTLSPDIV